MRSGQQSQGRSAVGRRSFLKEAIFMTKKFQTIISSKLFFGFCFLELLILVTLKVLQAIYPGPLVEIFPMFSAILLNTLFVLF
jgi:hypothetical protein